MARERSPARAEAEKLYFDSKGTMKLVDIAARLNLKDSQIRKWKSQDRWDDKLKGALPKKNSNVTNQKVTKRNNNKEAIADEVKEVMDNDELTDKQRLFCVIYARRMNATKAYQQAYKCSYETAMVAGPRLLGNVRIKEQVDSLTQLQFNKEALKRSVIQKYIDIAFADITDYVQFGQDYYIVTDKEGNPKIDDDGNVVTKPYNYVRLGESNQVDGTLISEIAEGKDGVKIKLADKMKALDFLTKHCNLLSDEEKIKLDIENKKLQNSKLEVEIDKAKGDGKGNESKSWAEAIQEIAAKRRDNNG
jgi:Phage terminase, small subunit